VGGSGDNFTPSAYWDGATWVIKTVPSALDHGSIDLTGVSCSPARACTAVGFYGGQGVNSTVSFPIGEAWDGSTWAQQTMPVKGGVDYEGAQLNAVSCTTTSVCTAVGSTDSTTASNVLVEREPS
jgi:hypothetical protein